MLVILIFLLVERGIPPKKESFYFEIAYFLREVEVYLIRYELETALRFYKVKKQEIFEKEERLVLL